MTDGTTDVDDVTRVNRAGLSIGIELDEFCRDEMLPDLGLDVDRFWHGVAAIIEDLAPRNETLLAERTRLQRAIDAWYLDVDADHSPEASRAFLTSIGYLGDAPDDVRVETSGVDPEIATIAAPQLVVPVTNARYALNAANARWGSLYDALYGTDALGDLPPSGPYDPRRGDRVVDWAKRFLDEVIPLATASHADVAAYSVVDGNVLATGTGGSASTFAPPAILIGHTGPASTPHSIIIGHHGLGIEIVIDRSDDVGGADLAGVADIRLEAAVTTIMDCEDSVAAVDAADKAVAYRNWLGLMRGDLTEEVTKAGSTFERSMATDREITAPDGATHRLRMRSLMLVRNVGHLMTTPAVRRSGGADAPEGIIDAIFTTTCALHDLRRPRHQRNSPAGSVYVVKPKMHGPEEVAFTDDLFGRVEALLGLERHTVKLGIMDEERRTTVNLAACIEAAKHRVAFINTGFLDRTGDEIHTSMEAGPMVRKNDMKAQPWIAAYEDWNVDVGVACGLVGVGQIGKGMWAAPDLMEDMLEHKVGHPMAGASCAWVPSPTAATLHATHYHRVDVADRQRELLDQLHANGPRATLTTLLTVPVAPDVSEWTVEEIQAELDNNAQGILGYVVRWVDQGVGCSKVPDIHDVGLMEDRATCRISSQHMANWLHHGVVDREQVLATMRKMAAVVDAQNADDLAYVPMSPNFDGPAFKAACELVVRGRSQPSGYTEPILHRWRLVATS